MTVNPIKVAIVDRNQLFRDIIAAFLVTNGFQVVLQLSDKYEMFNKVGNDTIPSICLLQIMKNESATEIEKFIKYLKINWPAINVICYSIEFRIPDYGAPYFGAEAVLTESDSLQQLEKVLNSIVQKGTIAIGIKE